MSQIIKLKTSEIKPSQDFLKENTIKFILKNYFNNRRDLFPPIPLVRFNSNTNEYVAIDGHNLIAIYDLLGEEMDVFLVDNNQDFLKEENFPNSSKESLESRNNDLKDKFDIILQEVEKVKNSGLNSFTDLRKKYFYLENLELAKKFCSPEFEN